MKPVFWIASSRKDLCAFPTEVRQEAGFALYLAQQGDKALNAKPLIGFGGANVLEVVIDHDGDAYRSVLYGAVRRGDLRPDAFQEEVEEGDRHAEART